MRFRPVMMIAIIAVLIAVSAAAQIPAGNPPAQSKAVLLGSEAFAKLVEGKKMLVTTKDGVRNEGFITSLSSTSLVVDGATVPFTQVTKVERVTHRIRAAVGGFVAGFAAGLLINFTACDDDDGCPAVIGALAVGGAAAGIGLGALAYHGFHDVVYDSRKRTTVAIAPIVTPTRKGVTFSMTWR